MGFLENLTVFHNFMFIVLFVIAILYVTNLAYKSVCIKEDSKVSAIVIFILTFVIVFLELIFCSKMIDEYNSIKNPDESITRAKNGLIVEAFILCIFMLVCIGSIYMIYRDRYCSFMPK